MSAFELVTLRNGARAVRERVSGEIMHPSVGPWAEATRLYVEQGRLAERLTLPDPGPVRVYDVGLGGGANAVAALACAEGARARLLELCSFDTTTEPLALALSDPAGFPFLERWAPAVRSLLERGAWDGERTRWRLLRGDFLERLPSAPGPADLVFFDPFSPQANPALWTPSVFERVRARMRPVAPGAELFTYSAATPTRVALLLAGFYVGAGASVASRAETTAASTRLENLAHPLGARWLERWKRSPRRAPHGASGSEETESAVLGHPQFVRS